MAARNRPGLSEATRKRIKTTMIVKRLQKHIVAKPELDPEIKQYVTKDLMTQSQVTAALGLIKKTLPDLQSTTLSNSDGSPLMQGITVQFVNADKTPK